MMSSFQDRMEACPICAALIPSAQIELHVNEVSAARCRGL